MGGSRSRITDTDCEGGWFLLRKEPSSRRRALSGLCRCRLQAADITHSANRWLHGWLAYDVAAGIPGGTTLRLTGSSDHLRGVVQVREANRRGKCVVARDEGGRVPPGRVRVDVPGAQFPTDSCPQRIRADCACGVNFTHRLRASGWLCLAPKSLNNSRATRQLTTTWCAVLPAAPMRSRI